MPTKNDVTGDSIQSKAPSQKYMDNYDAIFGKKSAVDDAADVNSQYINHWLKKPPEEEEDE
jgi:hypothetical protein